MTFTLLEARRQNQERQGSGCRKDREGTRFSERLGWRRHRTLHRPATSDKAMRGWEAETKANLVAPTDE